MPDAAPQRDAILAALERLLAWSEIVRSPQLGKFLDYIVRRTLDGDGPSIKAYSIAVDVLGRGDDFDPQADPIVRVQARRLRGLLDAYYQTAGSAETTRIHLPVGRYLPEFEFDAVPRPDMDEAPPPGEAGVVPSRGGVYLSRFAMLVIAIGVALVLYAISGSGPRQRDMATGGGTIEKPSLTIVEFQNLAGDGGGAPAVSGLAIELVTDLEQFDDIEVRYGGDGTEANPAGLPASDYVLTGIVRVDGAVVQYSAILTDTGSSSVVWNATMAVPVTDANARDALDKVSRRLSLVLGSSRGPLHDKARRFIALVPPAPTGTPYLCRMIFDTYRDTGGIMEGERARACIAALPETDRQKSVVLAMSASLAAELADPAAAPSLSEADRFRIAEANLSRAITLAPINSFVWEQRARLQESMGAYRPALADFSSAIQLNPASADALAAYARLLALGGELAQAIPMAEEAVDYSPSPPPWYQLVPALTALRDGDYAKALSHAELYAQADRELGPILAIMAGQGSKDSAAVNRYLPQVLDVPAFLANGVLPRLKQRIADKGLRDAIEGALISAGVPPNAMMHPF